MPECHWAAGCNMPGTEPVVLGVRAIAHLCATHHSQVLGLVRTKTVHVMTGATG